MEYYVRPRHIYWHSRTCTRSGLCRIPSILVAFHVCCLLDCASVHEISALVIWFSVYHISSSTMEILIHCISSSIMEILIYCISSSTLEILIYCILYMAMTIHVTFCISCLFMAIVLLCIPTAPCTCTHMHRFIIVLYWWVAGSYTWVFITPLLGWIL